MWSLELLKSIADCDQNFRSANLINCNQSDSTHSFHSDLCQCLLQSHIGTQCSCPQVRRGSVITDSNQDCSTETNPQLERNSPTRNPIQHKTINLINHLNFVFTQIKSHYRQAMNTQEKSTDAEQSKTVRKTSQLAKQPRSTQKNYSTCK